MAKKSDAAQDVTARRYFVWGRVQGVCYRAFAVHVARRLGLTGYTQNLDDGRVEVYAVGSKGQLSDLAGRLWMGPRLSDVRGVDEQEAPVLQYLSFHIKNS